MPRDHGVGLNRPRHVAGSDPGQLQQIARFKIILVNGRPEMGGETDVRVDDDRQWIVSRREAARPIVEFKELIGRGREHYGRSVSHIPRRWRRVTAIGVADRQAVNRCRSKGVSEEHDPRSPIEAVHDDVISLIGTHGLGQRAETARRAGESIIIIRDAGQAANLAAGVNSKQSVKSGVGGRQRQNAIRSGLE